MELRITPTLLLGFGIVISNDTKPKDPHRPSTFVHLGLAEPLEYLEKLDKLFCTAFFLLLQKLRYVLKV